uniref:Uncharacterized protein n=1 Tax=Compsopogon caeruleus TaxID=31354 RepID=A0A7S1THJ2_9RHOD|mmetsp:Transcript_7929/g.15921  ORF Transcript_7929/g.15921 Transcript_7929/m.15921 type:complete len:258 (+) Transcript_7929:2-775(+)
MSEDLIVGGSCVFISPLLVTPCQTVGSSGVSNRRPAALWMINRRRGFREYPTQRSLRGRFVQPTSVEIEMRQDSLSGGDSYGGRVPSRHGPTSTETDTSLSDILPELDDEDRLPSSIALADNASDSRSRWSRRAEAAKKRWADPEYRAKMMSSRRRAKDSANASLHHPRVEIGPMDSIVGSSDQKARMIIAYANANAKRAEKVRNFHQNQAQWIQDRLDAGAESRELRSSEQRKLETQQRRSEIARKRQACRKKTLD